MGLVAALLLFVASGFAQTGTLVGTITDVDGSPLPGVTVYIDLTTIGTATDQDGNYRLERAPSGEQTLVITYVGYGRIQQSINVPVDQELRKDIELNKDVLQLNEVAVTATRRETDITAVPRAIDVVGQETVFYYIDQTSDLSATLGKAIPNFTPPSIGNDVFTATLRGRAPFYLLDGVPLQTNEGLRGAVLGALDPSSIERIEVLYGASTIYGGGAPGGVIQFFTKQASEKLFDVDLQFSTRSYLVEGRFLEGEAVDYRTTATVSGTKGKFRYLVNGAFERTNGQFRPDGERIGGNGTSAYDDYSVFAKVGYDITATQSVDLNFTRTYREPNDLFFASVLSEEDLLADPEGAAAIGERVETAFSYDNPISQEYTGLNGTYENTNLFGGIFRVMGYYFDLNFQQGGADIRPFIQGNIFPAEWPGLFQTSSSANQFGARTEYIHGIGKDVTLTVGGDFLRSDDATPVTISSDEPFDTENRFDASGGTQDQGAPNRLLSGGAFAQADYQITEDLRVSGGARFDIISFDILPFVPTFTFNQPGALRLGGGGRNTGLSLNLGLSYEIVDNMTVFGNFAQGFSLPSLAFLVVDLEPGVFIEGGDIVSPQIVNTLDLGLRGKVGTNFAYGITGFYAYSEDGSQISFNSTTGQGMRVQAPQRNYGFELSLEAIPAKGLRISTNIALTETDVDPQDDGTFQPGSSIEAIPLTTSIRASYQIPNVPGLAFNAELYTLNNRDRAFLFLVDSDDDGQIDMDDDGNIIRADGYELKGYSTVDVGATFEFPQKWLGDVGGRLSLQVLNLLNETYIPAISQRQFGALFADRRRNGFGRNMTLTVTFDL
ncbi:MAG: TonB-dependent receptor [Bacteroidota bacterium]